MVNLDEKKFGEGIGFYIIDFREIIGGLYLLYIFKLLDKLFLSIFLSN